MIKEKNIFLIGPMGAGKTSVGKKLAEILNFRFFDTDRVIEEQTGADIPWIFDIEGEEGFRKRETLVVDQLTRETHIVLATGGGVVLKEQNRRYLSTRGRVIYLSVSADKQVKRTDKSRHRPLIMNVNANDVFLHLNEERESLYLEIADDIINTDHGSLNKIVEAILEKLLKKVQF